MNLHLTHQVQGSRFGDAARPSPHTRGLIVARLLSGSWREAGAGGSPPADAGASDISRLSNLSEAELTEITPLLCRSGAAALAWWQLRDTTLADCPAASQLREVYRRHRLSALLHEREIAMVVSLLRAEGIEAVLIKGWAVARRYPDRALRPYGDIDLCVPPDKLPRAARVLERIASIAGPFVDLHSGFTRIGQTKPVRSQESRVQSLSALRRLWTLDFGLGTKGSGDWDELFERSVLVQCPTSKVLSEPGAVATGFLQSSATDLSGRTRSLPLPVLTGVPVRVLCDEDHLRILCLHLLRSGAHRPQWLCDVAMILESVQSPKSKVQSPIDRVAVTDSRGLSVLCDTPGSDRINLPDPEGVKQDIEPRTLDSSFDWDICLGRNPVDANWVGVAVGLAHELLGVDISKTPFANQQLPRWVAPAVLEQWGGRRVDSRQSTVNSPSAATRLWTVDCRLWTDLFRRWDNPIRSTAAVGGRFNDRSRLPYRLLESAMRLPEFVKRLAELARSQNSEFRSQNSEFRSQESGVRSQNRSWC